MRKLTPKQQTFLNYLLEGYNKIDAYKKAYPSAKGANRSIQVAASKVYNSEVFQHYYKAATEKARDTAMYHRENAIEDLKLVIDKAKEDIHKNGFKFANSSALIKSVEVLKDLLMLGVENDARLKLDYDKLKLQQSKLKKDNDQLQTENAQLLRDLVRNAVNKETE